MPNWCENDVAISGPKEDIDELQALLGTEEKGFDCGLFVPYPDKYQNTQDEDLKNEGYWWRVDNWGTSRTGYWGTKRVDETRLSLWVDTAWAPFVPTILAMAKKFPLLEIELMYAEMGMDFKGYVTFAKGKIQDEWEGPYFEDEEAEESGYWGGIPSSSSGSLVILPTETGENDFPLDE